MRYVYLILLLLLTGVPFALRQTVVGNDFSEESKRGAERLIIVTPHNGDIRREFAFAFDQWHREKYGRNVVIDYRVPGGTSDLVRFLSTTYAAYRRPDGSLPQNMPIDIDIAWGGGDYTYYHDLQPLGILDPIRIDPTLLKSAFPQDALAGVRLYDATKDKSGIPTPQWVGICLSSFGIVYNSQLYQPLGLPVPQRWGDLTNPKLFQFIALADPAHSGSSAVAYMMVIQRAMADAETEFFQQHPELKTLGATALNNRPDYRDAIAAGWKRGMGQLVLIAANARYFTDSSEVVPTDVGRGEAAAGMAIDFYARVTEGIVGAERARFVSPRQATAITPDTVGILHGVNGNQLTLATHFVEFLLTPQAQRLWILEPAVPGGPRERSLRRMPIRRDVYADQSGWADHFNPFEEAGGFNQRGQWMALMSDTRPIWNAAWIDSHDALVEAYRTILEVKDDRRREDLLARLADLPVTMHDVEQRHADRLQLAKVHGDLDEWSARQRIEWGKRFREHFADVERLVAR